MGREKKQKMHAGSSSVADCLPGDRKPQRLYLAAVFVYPGYGLLTGEDRVQLQGVELSLIHAASLEEVRSQSPAKQTCMSGTRHMPGTRVWTGSQTHLKSTYESVYCPRSSSPVFSMLTVRSQSLARSPSSSKCLGMNRKSAWSSRGSSARTRTHTHTEVDSATGRVRRAHWVGMGQE